MPESPAPGDAHVTNRSGRDKSWLWALGTPTRSFPPKRTPARCEELGPAFAGTSGLRLALVRRARQHFLDLDRNAICVHHHGAARDRKVVHQDLHFVLFRGVELDDGAAAEPQGLV